MKSVVLETNRINAGPRPAITIATATRSTRCALRLTLAIALVTLVTLRAAAQQPDAKGPNSQPPAVQPPAVAPEAPPPAPPAPSEPPAPQPPAAPTEPREPAVTDAPAGDTTRPATPSTQPPSTQPLNSEAPNAETASAEAPSADTTSSSSSTDTDTITVVGTSLARTAGAAYVVGEKQLQRFQYDDPHAALVQIPGLYVRQEDGVGLRPNIGLRGANPDRSKKVTLMEDGVLFGPAPYSAPAAYYFPVLTRMTQIRVIDGPAAIAYGPQTVGGAIDFSTRAIPSTTSAMIDLAGGEYGYQKAHGFFGLSEERYGFLVEGLHLHNKGFKHLAGDDDADTGSTRNEWMVKGAYRLDPSAAVSHEFRIKLTYSEETSNETYLGLTDADLERDPDLRYPASALDRMNNHRTSLVFTHALEIPDSAFTLTTTLYRHDYHRIWRKVNRLRSTDLSSVLADPEDGSNAEYYAVLSGRADSATGGDAIYIGPNDRNFVSQGVQGVLSAKLQGWGLSHRIEAGLRFHNDSIERRHSEVAYLMSGGELVPEGTATEYTAANEARSYALAAHLLDAIEWGRLTVTPGLRLELIASELDDTLNDTNPTAMMHALLPGIGVFYALSDELGLLAGVYRGFSPPPPGSADHVKPEYSLNYEAGARLTLGRTRAEAIGFFNDYSNLTDTCTLSSGCLSEALDRQFDAGKAHIYGLQAHLEHEVPLGKLGVPFGASYTLTHAEFRRSFQSEDPIYGTVVRGDEMPYVPRHQLSAHLGLENLRAGLNASLTYVSAMREQAGHQPLSEAMATEEQLSLDLSAKLRVHDNIQLYANARNLFDARYIVARRPYGARPNAPRWIQIGIKAEL